MTVALSSVLCLVAWAVRQPVDLEHWYVTGACMCVHRGSV